jgi:hypothetical protein
MKDNPFSVALLTLFTCALKGKGAKITLCLEA